MSLARKTLYLLGLPLILIVVWWVSTLTTTNFFVPKPVMLVEKFIEVWIGERFFIDVVPSITRLFIGIVISIVLGVALGVFVGSFRLLRFLLEPVLEFFRAIPPPVLIPVLMLLLGISDTMKIAVTVSGCIWPVLLNTIEGVRAVDSVLADSARTYGIRGFARIRYLVLPGAAPQIMTRVRQCLSIGVVLMVIFEMFASSDGLGYTIVKFQRSFAIPEMWSGIVVLGLIGVLLSFLFQWVERRVLYWYHGLKEVENAA